MELADEPKPREKNSEHAGGQQPTLTVITRCGQHGKACSNEQAVLFSPPTLSLLRALKINPFVRICGTETSSFTLPVEIKY